MSPRLRKKTRTAARTESMNRRTSAPFNMEKRRLGKANGYACKSLISQNDQVVSTITEDFEQLTEQTRKRNVGRRQE